MHADGLTELLKLVNRRRAVAVRRDQQDAFALLLPSPRQLGGGGCLARPLQSGEENDAGFDAGKLPRACRAEGGDKLLVNDLDDLLGGVEGARDFRAHGARANPLEEILCDGEVHVGLEQRHADFAQRRIDVAFGKPTAAAQPIEDGLKFGGEGFEHGSDTKSPHRSSDTPCPRAAGGDGEDARIVEHRMLVVNQRKVQRFH